MYRTLRTNLEFTGVENRVISITSCAPDDGKSTVSFQLACALAESGKSTIYVDADMRRSVFAQSYNIDTEMKGLSHFLSGKIETSDVIYVTNKEKLYVLPTGVFPSNPTELLGNSRMNVLITALKKVFDYVIIDTPPLGSVIDAAVVSKFCDASMLVLASNTTSRAEAKKVIAQLKTANPNFLGVVLNKVDMKGSGYYYKRYGYGYGSYYGKRKNNDYY
jgi:capsular exopolysaccharide synthesis family protein